MKYDVKFTSQFKKDLKLAKKQNKNIINICQISLRHKKQQKRKNRKLHQTSTHVQTFGMIRLLGLSIVCCVIKKYTRKAGRCYCTDLLYI